MPKIILATRNAAKAREYALLLEGIPLEIVTLDELGIGRGLARAGLGQLMAEPEASR